jgi:hypothetical protein
LRTLLPYVILVVSPIEAGNLPLPKSQRTMSAKQAAQFLRSPLAGLRDARWYEAFLIVGNGDGVGTVRRYHGDLGFKGITAVLTEVGWRIMHDSGLLEQINEEDYLIRVLSWEKVFPLDG